MGNVALNKKILEDWKNSRVVTNGEHENYYDKDSYASAAWPKYMTLDLESVYEIETIRFLLYDKDERSYSFRLLTSLDSILWDVHYDTQNKGYKSWQEFNFKEKIKARYVRLHCLWNSRNAHYHIIEIQVFDRDTDKLNVAEINKRTISFNENKLIQEHRDGQDITYKMNQLISSLENLINENENLIQPKPFNNIIKLLRTQVTDISALENSIDAIRREILNPVTKELEYGNKLSKFSVWGFIVGFIGIIVSIFAILNNLFEWI